MERISRHVVGHSGRKTGAPENDANTRDDHEEREVAAVFRPKASGDQDSADRQKQLAGD
jgi:hypothetical protein